MSRVAFRLKMVAYMGTEKMSLKMKKTKKKLLFSDRFLH